MEYIWCGFGMTWDRSRFLFGELNDFAGSCTRFLVSARVHLASAFVREVQRNVGQSQDAAVDS